MTRDRIVARMLARAVMFVVFVGVGISFMLALIGAGQYSLPVCIGFGVAALIVLLVGSYLVARVKASDI
jgi:uncharacterized membrane protein